MILEGISKLDPRTYVGDASGIDLAQRIEDFTEQARGGVKRDISPWVKRLGKGLDQSLNSLKSSAVQSRHNGLQPDSAAVIDAIRETQALYQELLRKDRAYGNPSLDSLLPGMLVANLGENFSAEPGVGMHYIIDGSPERIFVIYRGRPEVFRERLPIALLTGRNEKGMIAVEVGREIWKGLPELHYTGEINYDRNGVLRHLMLAPDKRYVMCRSPQPLSAELPQDLTYQAMIESFWSIGGLKGNFLNQAPDQPHYPVLDVHPNIVVYNREMLKSLGMPAFGR